MCRLKLGSGDELSSCQSWCRKDWQGHRRRTRNDKMVQCLEKVWPTTNDGSGCRFLVSCEGDTSKVSPCLIKDMYGVPIHLQLL
nr:hypothetical protein CFP56_16824 [Quercus suber]